MWQGVWNFNRLDIFLSIIYLSEWYKPSELFTDDVLAEHIAFDLVDGDIVASEACII